MTPSQIRILFGQPAEADIASRHSASLPIADDGPKARHEPTLPPANARSFLPGTCHGFDAQAIWLLPSH